MKKKGEAKYSKVYGWHTVKPAAQVKKGDVVVQIVNRGMGQIDGKVAKIEKLGSGSLRFTLENTSAHSVYFKTVTTVRTPCGPVRLRAPYQAG